MRHASALRTGIKYVVGAVIIACIAFFFYRAFDRNWASIQAQHVEFQPGFLLLAVLCMLVTYLVPTYGWQFTINALGRGKTLTYAQTVATVNSSNLVKYVPGKVLTYALQMYWLSNRGFSKTLVMYVNGLSLLVSLAMSVIVGLVCLLLMPSPIPTHLTLALLAAAVVVDVVLVRYHSTVLAALVRIAQRLLKRELTAMDVPVALLVRLHAVHFVSVVAFSAAAYFSCRGIGYFVPASGAPRLMAAILVADTVAFFAIVTPGGLGVREGLMYLVLGGASGTSLAITLPLATRVVHMFVDVLLGTTAFRLLRNLTREPVPPLPAPSHDATPP